MANRSTLGPEEGLVELHGPTPTWIRVHTCPPSEEGEPPPAAGKGQPLGRVREIRDDIRARVERLVSENGWGR